MKLRSIVLLSVFFGFSISAAQRIPDPNVGDVKLRREGIMKGNLVRTIFINWGELTHWPDSPSGEWPKGSGHQYVDGIALVVQARAEDNNGQIIYPMETQYREFVDKGPLDQLWGWAPLPGYSNPLSTSPAVSDDPSSWPSSWPGKEDGWVNPNEVQNGFDDDGNGLVDDLVFWNGFFGKGEFNAQAEAYFVFDDDPDEEWDFYPDPGDPERRGLGLEVEARYFQWSQVLAEDVIFAVYFITNEGKTDYDSTYYSFYIDWGIGGTDDSSDDTGDYDLGLDIAWAWDGDGFGTPGNWNPVGVAGFAFLESPGIDNDNFDNDGDGLIDENRTDGDPGVWLDTYPYGIDDVDKFDKFYGGRQPVPHWSSDEDGDWRSYDDVNGNDQWDKGEALNDDVGADGLGPNSFGYSGPDVGEGDGMPTTGDPGEPNFDQLDKDEADQIGLTGFRIFPVHTYELWNEKQNWEVFKSAPPPHSSQVTANLGMFFSSGPFPLKAGDTQNYSMALLFGEDADDLVLTRDAIQQIYNADYRFSKPPDKPKILSVTPGDNKVTITWDSRAEDSWDPFLQQHDFEGYRIYRSTEPEFLSTRLITDAHGRATFRKPIAQFDLKDDITGLHQIHKDGAHFNMGLDSGLRHYYVDTDVKNGQTYYYAVVSYDYGLIVTDSTDGSLAGITPSECTSQIEVDVAGNVSVDINTAVVVPGVPAAGYIDAGLDENVVRETIGTGDFSIDFVHPDSVIDGHEYEIVFSDTSYFHNIGNPYYLIFDVTDGNRIQKTDTIWIDEFSQSPIIDGFTIGLQNDETDIDYETSRWLVGSETNYRPRVNLDKRFVSFNINYPADYEIRFSDTFIDTAINRLGFPPETPTKFSIYNVTEGVGANYQFFDFYEKDSTFSPFYANQNLDSTESAMIWLEDPNPDNLFGIKTTWRFYFEADPSGAAPIPPAAGDVLLINTKKPFRNGDKITFKVKGEEYDTQQAKKDMNDIAVVPNPYLASASWEPRSAFRSGRGERRIFFINLPSQCTIRIYTLRGYLVRTIEHNTGIEIGQEPWNLLSKDGQEIAYGIYIYHVDAPGVGKKIGKFAIIK